MAKMVVVTRLTLVKFFELALVCAIFALHYQSHPVTREDIFLGQTTFGGYLIILVGLFAGGLMGTPVNRRVDLFFSLIGCALFIASGAIILQYKSNNDYRTATGALSIIEGALFFLDAIFTFRGEA